MSQFELRPHRKEDNLTSGLPFPYQPGAFPRISAWLYQSVPDNCGRLAYMAHIGLALLGDKGFHKALVVVGPPRSGKTTALALAQMATGQLESSFAGKVLFEGSSHGGDSRAQWRNSPLVCLDEWPEEALQDGSSEDNLKAMTSHSGVTTKRLYKSEERENRWRAKLMFATNTPPRFKDKSGAVMRRLIFVRFPRSLPDRALDAHLLDRLRDELPAFVAACLDVAMITLRFNEYPESTGMASFRDDTECRDNSVKLWVRDDCVLDPSAKTPMDDMNADYARFCEDNEFEPIPSRKLTGALRDRYGVENGTIKREGISMRARLGIRLRGADKEITASDNSQGGHNWTQTEIENCDRRFFSPGAGK